MKIKLITCILFLIHFDCSSSQTSELELIHPSEILLEIENQEFSKFLSNFNDKTLPYDAFPRIDEEFSSTRRISREFALKYLCSGNEKCLIQPSSGYFNYYYSNVFPSPKGLVVVTFYREFSEGVDYVICVFNTVGLIIDQMVLAGQIDESIEREAVIKSDLTIKLSEIIYQFNNTKTLDITGTLINRFHHIDRFGNIRLDSSNLFEDRKFIMDEKQSYRIIEKQ